MTGCNLTRIQELLAERDCRVPYTSLHRFVDRRQWRRRRANTVRMGESAPGEVAELDFGRLGFIQDRETDRRQAVWALLVVLTYSRHCFVWPAYGQKLEEVIAGLEAAWKFFGGIPKYLVIDNFPAAVAGADALHPRLTRGFLEYSQHRGFITDPARVRHPKDKPIVERSVQYARERFFKGGDFRDLAHLRSEAARWCRDVAGMRIHGTTRRQPLQVFLDEEQPVLVPWNGEPYEVTHWRSAKVHPDHHVACQYALYSVPSTLCPPGQQVEVGLGVKLVRIYHRGQLVKVHPRQPRGGRSTDTADYPAELSAYTLRAPDGIKRSAAEQGPAVGEFADRLFDGPLPWSRIRQGHKLIRLGQRYTPERLDSACRRAPGGGPDRRGTGGAHPAPGPGRGQDSRAAPTPASGPVRPPRRGIRPRESSQPSVNRIHRINRRRSVMTRVTELTPLLKRLQLGPMAATLPERIALASKGPAGLCFLPRDHPLRRGQPPRRPASGIAAARRRLRGDLPVGRLRLVRRHLPGPPAPGRCLLPGVPLQA